MTASASGSMSSCRQPADSAPAGSDIREEGLATVLDGNTAVALSEAGIATHAALKTALDPKGILTPGKVFDGG